MDKLELKAEKFLCIGLDIDVGRLPTHLSKTPDGQLKFAYDIMKVTNHVAAAYKINTAFFEAEGHEGIRVLQKICDRVKSFYPGIPLILDAKRVCQLIQKLAKVKSFLRNTLFSNKKEYCMGLVDWVTGEPDNRPIRGGGPKGMPSTIEGRAELIKKTFKEVFLKKKRNQKVSNESFV